MQHSSGLWDCCPPTSGSESNHGKSESSALHSGVQGMQDPICSSRSSSRALGSGLWLSDMNAVVGWQPIAPYLPLQEICPALVFFLFLSRVHPVSLSSSHSPSASCSFLGPPLVLDTFPNLSHANAAHGSGMVFRAYLLPSPPASIQRFKSCSPQGHGMKS